MSDSVAVRITADIAGLKEQLSAAESAISDLAGAFSRLGGSADTSQAQQQVGKTAEMARRVADEIAQTDERLSLKEIAARQSANNAELAMGGESVELWKGIADKEALAKYTAEVLYLREKAAADKSNAVAEQRDQVQLRIAEQDRLTQTAQIDQQYAEKKRQLDQAALQQKIQSDNLDYQSTVSKLDAELRDHQTSASQRAQAEIALAATVERQELAMFDATHLGLEKGNAAYDQAMKERQAIINAFGRRVETANNQLTSEEAQKWNQLGNSIRSSFNSAIDGMIFQGKSFGQGMLGIAQGVIKAFLAMGENIAENWIESQLTALFTTKATQGTTAMGQIADAAGVAGANAFAATAAIPIIGPELAPAAGAAAASEALSFSSLLSLAVGAWELKNDTVAQLHRGEMVVPQNFASGLRSHGNGLGGDVNMHYAPTINAREPVTLSQMLTRESGEMLSWLNRQFRNGALRV
ncbi:MAG TPA: hypothetical protein VHU23_16785 [Rhizomicrobium sp.]|jgi:hypothetical protein|nr:hypothetical protein [Rhizomicrobium sp.]